LYKSLRNMIIGKLTEEQMENEETVWDAIKEIKCVINDFEYGDDEWHIFDHLNYDEGEELLNYLNDLCDVVDTKIIYHSQYIGNEYRYCLLEIDSNHPIYRNYSFSRLQKFAYIVNSDDCVILDNIIVMNNRAHQLLKALIGQ